MHKDAPLALFRLIRNMTKAEKKHFKLYSSYHSANASEMVYHKLFDEIEKQNEYNEKKIIEKGIVRKERIRAVKHYLYNLILESLLAFRNKGNDIDSKLHYLHDYGIIMRDKGLEKEEIRFFEKAKGLALHNEQWDIALGSFFAERKALLRIQDFKSLDRVSEELEAFFLKLNNLKEYMVLNEKIFSCILKAGPFIGKKNKELEKLIKHPLMGNVNKALSSEAKMIYYDALYSYYYFLEDHASGYKILKAQVKFAEESPYRFAMLTHAVLLNNLTIVQQYLGKYNEALSTIHKQRALVWKSKKAEVQNVLYTYISETNLYLLSGKFEKDKSINKEIENYLQNAKPEFTWQLNLLYYNMAYLYFGNENYHAALKWVTVIINNPKIIFREDLLTSARILQIIIHYELKTEDIMEHLLASTERYLVKRKERHKTEERFLQFMKIIEKKNKIEKNLVNEFKSFRNELLQLSENPKEKSLVEYFDLISWLDSKIEGRSFAEVVARK